MRYFIAWIELRDAYHQRAIFADLYVVGEIEDCGNGDGLYAVYCGSDGKKSGQPTIVLPEKEARRFIEDHFYARIR